MDIDGSVFAFKLYEMEEQYGKLQCRVRICEEGSRDKIHSELKRAEDEYEESTMLLREKAKSCRSRAVAKLSQAQLDYRQKVEELKKQIKDDLCHTRHAAGADLGPECSGQREKSRDGGHRGRAERAGGGSARFERERSSIYGRRE